MNIFYLSEDPKISARAMTSKHIVKMVIETAQLLSTAHHILDGDASPYSAQLYKSTHKNHPSAVWARESYENYDWLYIHFVELCNEYTRRYGKVHATETKLKEVLFNLPKNIPYIPATPMRLAIADKSLHLASPVASYRLYYEKEKLVMTSDIERYYNIIVGGA